MKLQASEDKALDAASLLIKYAAESPKTLPENLMMPIALAWKAREDNAWSPDVSTKFWTAYSALCDLLKPVTLETISASEPTKCRRWIFGDYVELTRAQRTANHYRTSLVILLAFAIVCGFVASAATKMSDAIKDFTGRGNAAALEAAAAIATIKSELDRSTPPGDNLLTLPRHDSIICPRTTTR